LQRLGHRLQNGSLVEATVSGKFQLSLKRSLACHLEQHSDAFRNVRFEDLLLSLN
jgi:hypothetical protein